jgi:hypothetical protein
MQAVDETGQLFSGSYDEVSQDTVEYSYAEDLELQEILEERPSQADNEEQVFR